MDIKSIKSLAEQYSFEDLTRFADEFEATGIAPVKTQEDDGAQMSDYLMAAELKHYLDKGMPMQEAVREFSKRVRGVLT
jgi:hypothetical protein